MKNLRIKVTMLIILAVLTITGVLLLLGYRQARDSMSAQREANYSVEADRYAQELTAWVNTNATLIETMAADITTSGIDTEGYEAFHAYLEESRELLNKNGYIFDIYFTYPNNTMACASDFQTDGTDET